MEINFFGKKTFLTVLVLIIIAILSNTTKLPQDLLWKIVIELEDQIPNSVLKDEINRKIITTPELLDYKIKRDLDKAIEEYKKQEPLNLPQTEFYELPPDGSTAQELLGGAIGIRSTVSK